MVKGHAQTYYWRGYIVADNHMKRCLMSLVTGERQIKTVMGYYYILNI